MRHRRVPSVLLALPLALLLAVLTFASTNAFAAGGPGGGTSTAQISGSNGLTESSDFSTALALATLNGSDQNIPYHVAATVYDLTGTGAGWKYQESATSLSDGQGHTLIQTVTGVDSVACNSSGTCTLPTSNVIYSPPLSMDSNARTFYNAAAHTGLGVIDLVAHMNVAIPDNAYAGTYTSVVTFAIVSGP